MRVPIAMFLALLLGCCLDLGSALFFKKLRALRGLTGGAAAYGGSGYGVYGGSAGYSSGYNGYGYNPGYNGYGYNGGYNAYGGGYGGSYGGGYGGGYSGYGYGYPQQGRRPRQGHRKGRTYSEIARVLKPDPYLGLGAGRYLPRASYSHLWG